MGQISFEEYEAAYRSFIACLEETGVEFAEHGLDSEHQRFNYGTFGELDPVTGKIPSDGCYERHFADADRRWQLQKQEPFAKATFDRALAFFADRGVTNFPESCFESGSVGGLIGHAKSILGDEVAHEYLVCEHSFELRQRIGQLETEPAPEPWNEVANHAVQGLLAVGLSEDGRHCLVVSGQGRSVIDLTSGEVVSQDSEVEPDTFLSHANTVATGIGPLDDVSITLAGVWGGGLPTSTTDGWFTFRFSPEWPSERVVLQAPASNFHNSYGGLTQLSAPINDVRAVGFTIDGQALVLATDSRLEIWRR